MTDPYRATPDYDREEARSIRATSLASRYEQLHGMTRAEMRAEVGDEW